MSRVRKSMWFLLRLIDWNSDLAIEEKLNGKVNIADSVRCGK